MEVVYTSSNSHMITVEQTQLYHPKTQETKQHIHIPTIHKQQHHHYNDTKVLSGVWETNVLSF